MVRYALLGSLLLAAACQTTGAAAQKPGDSEAQALEILKRSVAFRTVDGAGQVPAYAAYIKSVLVEAGFAPGDIEIVPVAKTAYLTARFRGADAAKKPLVISGHMDVVEAKREDWERDPFTPVVENGFVFGRGSLDNKGDVSIVIATLAKLKREGWTPGRDVILALSGDEETQMESTRVLAARLKGAELVLNADAGGGALTDEGKALVYGVQTAEKTYADYTLTITDPGGHSSVPTTGNPIYRLSAALSRLSDYAFPVMRSELTDAFFRTTAPMTPGPVGDAMKRLVADPQDAGAIATLSADPRYSAQLRTTCVATMIDGGHAANALPQRAMATVNCRIFPGVPLEVTQMQMAKALNDPSIVVAYVDTGTVVSAASPLRADVLAAVTKAVHARHPDAVIIPNMSTGATDSMHFRAQGVPSYGVAAGFMNPKDEFAHGLNERFPLALIPVGLAHWESLLRDLAG
ncbi:MAG: M20/M25/M40 family metallo-hydrolase [Hyphomonadaceae bacterium]|nr:M20/M25/M40 family metallo-hydrolase [Hyphomonadaceae bacterium]